MGEASADGKVRLIERDFRGSRFRCLLATSQPRKRVAEFLTALTPGIAAVDMNDVWAPDGFRDADEAQLGETREFLELPDREALTTWWLVNRNRATTPNWDLVSTCKIGDRKGLLLVEGKAHLAEFADDQCSSTNRANRDRIELALKEASNGWDTVTSRDTVERTFGLSVSSYYQLSNRFAFAWKLAQLKIPVALVYLGFLDAHDMREGRRQLIESHAQWRDWVMNQANDIVPRTVWGKTYEFDKVPVSVLIKTASVDVETRVVKDHDEGDDGKP